MQGYACKVVIIIMRDCLLYGLHVYICVHVCVCVYESCWVQLIRKLYQTNNAVRGFLLSLSILCIVYRHPHWLMSVGVDVVVYFESLQYPIRP